MPMNPDGTFSRVWKFVDRFLSGDKVKRADLDAALDDFVDPMNVALQKAGSAEGFAQAASVSADTAEAAKADAIASKESAANSASLSEQSAQSAENDKLTAKGYRDEVISESAKAKGWAETPVDVEVEAGSYSSKHHATKASESATASVTAKNEALAAEAGSQAARDAAILGAAGVYADTASGIAATVDGDFFMIPSPNSDGSIDLYLNNATVAEFKKTFPSTEYLAAVSTRVDQVRVDLAGNGLLEYIGGGPIYPLFVSEENNVLLGWDDTDKRIVGIGIHGEPVIKEFAAQVIASKGALSYLGSGPVWPIVTDNHGRVLLGFDEGLGSIVGAGLSQSTVLKENKPTPLPASLKAFVATHNGLICYGQSLSVGAKGTPIVSTSQPYSNLTFQGGPRAYDGSAYSYLPLRALVEDSNAAPDGGTNRGETPCSGAANYASTLAAIDGADPQAHIILASSAGHGGYRIDQLEKGTVWYDVLIEHITQAYAANNSYALHAICWLQGENDVAAGTSYATYRAKLEQLQADIEADAKLITGQASPVFFITYQMSYGAGSHPDMALAQLDLCRENDRFYLATPTYLIPHDADNVHLDDGAAYKWVGLFFGKSYKQLVLDGVESQWLDPISATVQGNIVTIKFKVPVEPLVLDNVNLPATTDHGFAVTANGQPQAITDIAAAGDTVTISLSGVPAGAIKVRYGLDHLGAGLSITNGGSGNLRDSAPSSISISGTERPLYHVCPHFELTAFSLGE